MGRTSNAVSVTGDFADWGSGYPMTRAQDGFGVTLRFKPGARLVYKLIVDGVWTLDPDSPTETDSAGNRNHVLIVPDYVPPRASRPPLALGGLRGSAAEASEGSGGGTPRALGYIGAGVHREYSDEYGIDVSGNFGKGSSSMARSVSFADVGSLVHLVQAWGGGKSVAAGVAGADKGLSAGLAGGLGAARAKLSAAAALPPTPGPSEAAALPAFEVGASAALAALSAPAAASVAVASVSGAGDAGSAVAQSGAPTAMLRSVASVSKLASVAAPAGAAAPAAPLSTVVQASLRREGKLVLSMVGLPARGKTFIARRLKRHLTWMGYKTEIFNVGNYRRQHHGALQPADFFDPTNAAGEVARREVAMLACEEMCASLASDAIDIAIFDGEGV